MPDLHIVQTVPALEGVDGLVAVHKVADGADHKEERKPLETEDFHADHDWRQEGVGAGPEHRGKSQGGLKHGIQAKQRADHRSQGHANGKQRRDLSTDKACGK